MKVFKYNGIDYFRMIAAFLIIAIHIGPLSSINITLDFGFTYVLCRIAVPFFLMTTGYFVLYPVVTNNDDTLNLFKFLKKTLFLYLIAIIIYLPINIYAGEFYSNIGIIGIIRIIFLDGTFYHLWYLPAVIVGCIFVFLLSKKFSIKKIFIISLLLYIFGLMGDSYYGLIKNIYFINEFYDVIFKLTSFTRNGVFYAPIFLIMGVLIRKISFKAEAKEDMIYFVISMVCMLIEGLILYHFDIQRHTSMYIFLLPSMFFFFQILLSIKGEQNKDFRNISMYIYIIHPIFILAVRMAVKVFDFMSIFTENSVLNYITVSILSYTCAVLINIFFIKYKENKNV